MRLIKLAGCKLSVTEAIAKLRSLEKPLDIVNVGADSSGVYVYVTDSEQRTVVYCDKSGAINVKAAQPDAPKDVGLGEVRKNLCFYLYPVKGSIWVDHIEYLKRYNVFNGKKIVTIAIDDRTVSPEEVLRALSWNDVLPIIVKNNPRLGEAAAFVEMLKLVQSRDENELTFYAHGKGVTRGATGWMENIRAWIAAMYFLNLSCPALIERVGKQYDAIGCFRISDVNHGGSTWHFSGSFFWMKHSAIFSKHWEGIYEDYFAVEGYLGRHIACDRAFCLTEPTGLLYWEQYPMSKCDSRIKRLKREWRVS